MLIRPELLHILMLPADGEGDPGGGGDAKPPPEIDWRARYEALEAEHRQTATKLDQLERDAQGRAEGDVAELLARAEERVKTLEARERERVFMDTATRGAPEATRGQLELMIRGEIAADPELGKGDPDLAAGKLRKRFEERGFGALLEASGTADEEAKPKPKVPPTIAPATKGERDWSKVVDLNEVARENYGDIPDQHWIRLTGQ